MDDISATTKTVSGKLGVGSRPGHQDLIVGALNLLLSTVNGLHRAPFYAFLESPPVNFSVSVNRQKQ
jgi:hypothetical protein